MVDHVARAMAQKAMNSGGGGVSTDSYSKEDINKMVESLNKKITELEEQLKNVLVISD